MSDEQQLTAQEMEAIATVVARLVRGRGKWFDPEATAVRFGKIAGQNLGFREPVRTQPRRFAPRPCAISNRGLAGWSRTPTMRESAARASKKRRAR